MVEVWKDINGYEGLYKISNLGNVKSVHYRGGNCEKNLTPKCNNSGRLWVDLRKDGKSKPMLIHRLVGMAFLPNPHNFPEINHIDENPKNNNVCNLEWCTSEYNIRYSVEKHPSRTRKVFRNKKIVQLSKDGKVIKIWENLVTIRHETGWNDWHIEECCKGNRKTAKGYMWRYAI